MSSIASFDAAELLCLSFTWEIGKSNDSRDSKLLLATFSFENYYLKYSFTSFLLPAESGVRDCNKFQSPFVEMLLLKFTSNCQKLFCLSFSPLDLSFLNRLTTLSNSW